MQKKKKKKKKKGGQIQSHARLTTGDFAIRWYEQSYLTGNKTLCHEHEKYAWCVCI